MRSIGNCGNNIRFSSKLTFTWERGSGMGGKEKGGRGRGEEEG